MSKVKPPLLKKGDNVAIVAPAGLVEKEYIDNATDILNSWGLKVVHGNNLFAQYNQFAGNDKERLNDMQQVLDDDQIRAIFCARGGYGSLRILDLLHWHCFEEAPKWIVGFSDITALHASVCRLGIESIHGVMPINMNKLSPDADPLSLLHKVLFNGNIDYKLEPHALNKPGTEKAELIGGNLTLLSNLSGTPYDFDYKEKILFIEEVGEHYYHFDRMLQGLRLSGKLDTLNGAIIGGLSEMKDNKRPFGRTPEQIVADVFADYDIPVAFGFPAGHITRNLPLKIGADISLEVSALGVNIKF